MVEGSSRSWEAISMFMKIGLRVSMAAATLLMVGLPAFSQSGDPVADAARQAREKKAAAAKPKKVYTEDDISSRKSTDSDASAKADSPATDTAANSADTTQAQTAPSSSGSSSDDLKKQELMWRKRFADARGKVTAAEKELDILQREEQKAQVQYYSDPQKALMEQTTRKDVNDKNAKIEAKKQEIAQLKQNISDMEDELRKSGGDPGWGRE